jgi:hypothetical protein
MQVEHVESIRPIASGVGSRARAVLSVAVPIVGLVVVVATAVLGREDARPASADDDPPVVVAIEPLLEPTQDASSAVQSARPADTVDFPPLAFGLRVRTSAQTLERLHDGRLDDGLVAVSGWLTLSPYQPDCSPVPDPTVAHEGLCRRDAVLSDTPDQIMTIRPDGPARAGRPGPHLHPQVLPGVSLSGLAPASFASLADAVRPIPVVVLGRFGDARARSCLPARRHCGEAFVLERLAWANGEWIRRSPFRSPDIEGPPMTTRLARLIGQDSLRDGRIVLSEALVPRTDLALIDPAADAAVPNDVDGPVWYLRTIVRRAPTGEREGPLRWIVVDDTTGRVLAAADVLPADPR